MAACGWAPSRWIRPDVPVRNREVVVPGTARGGCSVSNSSNCLANAAGLAPGSLAKADISAWLFDVRGGFQIGPLLIEGMYMFSSGNKARDTTLNNVHYFQPLTTDTGYLADWGAQLSALGLDYLNAQMESAHAIAYPGVAIGWDKYGRQQISAKASYFLTPNLSAMAGAAVHLTHRQIDTDGITQNSVGGAAGGGLLPAFATGKQAGDTNYMGTELFSVVTWRFAPGLSWDNGAGYMFAGDGTGRPDLGDRPSQRQGHLHVHVPAAPHVLKPSAPRSECRPGGNPGPVVVSGAQAVAVVRARGYSGVCLASDLSWRCLLRRRWAAWPCAHRSPSAEEYRLQVANLYRDSWLISSRDLSATGRASWRCRVWSATLQLARMPPGALLTDRMFRSTGQPVNGFGAVKVRASLVRGGGLADGMKRSGRASLERRVFR